MKFWMLALGIAATAISCAHRNRAAITQPPPQPVMERQIRNAIDLGDGDLQLQTLQRRMAAEPDNLQARLDLANAYQERGSKELALEHYRLAAGRFPESGEVQLRLVKAMRGFGLQADAASALEAFLNAHPQQSPDYPSWLGILRDELGQLPAGETSHRAALALNPNSDSLRNNLGYNLLMQGKSEEAAEEFRKALQLNPSSAVARNNLGTALADMPEQAVQNLRSVSDPATAHSNMAALLIEQGKYAEARRELDLALGYNRNHSAALTNLRLVSQLDGKPAFIPIRPVQTRWAKWRSTLRKVLVGPGQAEGTPSSTPENRRGL